MPAHFGCEYGDYYTPSEDYSDELDNDDYSDDRTYNNDTIMDALDGEADAYWNID